MIPLSAPSISANVAKANGAVPSAAAKGGESADFAAMLGATEVPAATPQTAAADLAAALVAALAGLPDGKSGKAGGKNLPDGAGDLETSETPDEADPDQADVPIAAAIPVLPLNVPPLPGIGNPVEFRAAVPDQAPARATMSNVPAQAAPAAQQAVQKQAVTRTAVPAQVLGIELAPVTVEAEAEIHRTVGQTLAAAPAQLPPVKTASASGQNPAQNSETPDPLVLSVSKDGEPGGAPASFDKLRTSGRGADSEPVAAKAPSPANATRETPSTRAAVASREAPTIAAGTADATKRGDTEPKPATAAKDRLATNGTGLDRAAEITQPILHQAHSAAQAAPARVADAAPAVSAAQSTPDQPHDFATLVDRLSEAREAASPQIVRTALQHAEFGRVSLQFRHDDANLSVTMANADPAFNSAVHSAVAASLAGNAAGQGDRGDSQQQQSQQQQAAPQQQSASSAGSNSQGQQQSAQARAEQAERMFQRPQGSAARTQQGESASSGRSDGRRSGIYA